MKNLIKITFLFSLIYLNASDLLQDSQKNKISKFTKIRQFFYLKNDEKNEKLKQNELENNLKKNILYQIAKNNEYKNPSIDKKHQMPEVFLLRNKPQLTNAQREIAINNIASNIESNINNVKNNINDVVLNIENNKDQIEIEIENNLNKFNEEVEKNENKLNKIIDIHSITENLAQLHIIGISKAEKQEFENKIKHFIHGALQIATIAGTIYITVHNIKN